jgi:NhaC family Na+:H+ antiporter
MAADNAPHTASPAPADPQAPPPASGRPPKLAVALIPLVSMALLLGIGYGVYKIKAQVLLVAAATITAFMGLLLGFKWKDMERGIVESIHKAMPAILIMLSVGILVGSWMASGTIPMVIYYGLKLISPKFFLATACLVCSVVSIASGTSWGTIGTVGVAFIGIAMGLGIPLGPAAGAVVAGAYVGDKLSPLSDIPNLATVISGSNLFDHIKHMMWSAVPAWLAGLAIYFVVGLKYGAATVRSETLDLILTTLKANFRFSLLLLLPMAVIFYFAVAKPTILPWSCRPRRGLLAVVVQKILFTTVHG